MTALQRWRHALSWPRMLLCCRSAIVHLTSVRLHHDMLARRLLRRRARMRSTEAGSKRAVRMQLHGGGSDCAGHVPLFQQHCRGDDA